MGKKILVAYFSASGRTEKAALSLAKAANAVVFAIEPQTPYTSADLDWTNRKSRTTLEKNDPASRPAIKSRVENMEDYDVVFLGFPIWWYTAPAIVKTFLESYDFSGKTIVLFATSGGSGFGHTKDDLAKSVSKAATIVDGMLMNGNCSEASLKAMIGKF